MTDNELFRTLIERITLCYDDGLDYERECEYCPLNYDLCEEIKKRKENS